MLGRATQGNGVPDKKAAVAEGTLPEAGSGSRSGHGDPGFSVEADLAAIVTGIAAGQRDALKQLYDRFGARLYGIAHRILRDSALAEDAIQEAFVKIWRNAGKFDPARGSALGWVVIIVRRAAFDLRPGDLVAEPVDIPCEQPETDMLHPGLARALNALPRDAPEGAPPHVRLRAHPCGDRHDSGIAARDREELGPPRRRRLEGSRRRPLNRAGGEAPEAAAGRIRKGASAGRASAVRGRAGYW